MSEQREVFRTYEGMFRILVEQVIDGKEADWSLIDLRDVASPDKLVRHIEAVKRFVGRDIEWTGQTTESGYEFIVAK